jgi:hypothetical protein
MTSRDPAPPDDPRVDDTGSFGASNPDIATAAQALAVVLDLEADELRADSPLVDLGADAIARIQWADVVEQLSAERGAPLVVDNDVLPAAATLGDLAAGLRPAGAR